MWRSYKCIMQVWLRATFSTNLLRLSCNSLISILIVSRNIKFVMYFILRTEHIVIKMSWLKAFNLWNKRVTFYTIHTFLCNKATRVKGKTSKRPSTTFRLLYEHFRHHFRCSVTCVNFYRILC